MNTNLKLQVVDAILKSDAEKYLSKMSRKDIEELKNDSEVYVTSLYFEITSPNGRKLETVVYMHDSSKKRVVDGEGIYLDVTTTIEIGFGSMSSANIDDTKLFLKLMTYVIDALDGVPRYNTVSSLVMDVDTMKKAAAEEAEQAEKRKHKNKVYIEVSKQPDVVKGMRIGTVRKMIVEGSDIPNGSYTCQHTNKMISVVIDGNVWTLTRFN